MKSTQEFFHSSLAPRIYPIPICGLHLGFSLVHIFVYLKPGHPELDPHLLIRFDDEMHDRFVERGFTLPPAISYSDLQENIA